MSILNNSNIFSKEEYSVAKELLNSININNNKNEITYFLTEIEQKVLTKIVNYNNLKLQFFGGFDDAERKRAKIIANEYYDIDFNIVCLEAKFNAKFHNIKHKDVLGAIHNIGVNYNRIGDIIINDDSIFIFSDEIISEYVIMNFSRIGKAVLNFSVVRNLENLNITKEYKKIEIVSSSHRLDNIVSKITNKSRSAAKEMLHKEFIKVNHTVITNGEKNCNIGDLISVRKYGRYTIKSSRQNSKSLKFRITLDKLV